LEYVVKVYCFRSLFCPSNPGMDLHVKLLFIRSSLPSFLPPVKRGKILDIREYSINKPNLPPFRGAGGLKHSWAVWLVP